MGELCHSCTVSFREVVLLFFRIFGLSLTFGRGHRRLLVGPEGFGFLGVILGFGFVDAMKCFFALLAIPRRKVGGCWLSKGWGVLVVRGCYPMLVVLGCPVLVVLGCCRVLVVLVCSCWVPVALGYGC